jgi:tRNA (Thr-GGU) A37 N-methylase
MKNRIGFSIVRFIGVDGCTLHVEDVDIIDGTPLLDIKPYVPDFDMRETDQIGWLAGRSSNVRHAKSDGRLK